MYLVHVGIAYKVPDMPQNLKLPPIPLLPSCSRHLDILTLKTPKLALYWSIVIKFSSMIGQFDIALLQTGFSWLIPAGV